MSTEVIDPRAIRNVTVVGDPDQTIRVLHRLTRAGGGSRTGAASTIHWTTDHIEHTIRLTELSAHAPTPDLERTIRTADGVITVLEATERSTPRLDTALRVADDHQVARLCLVTGLDHPTADFDRCIRTVRATHGAVPLPLQFPQRIGAEFAGVVDLIPMSAGDPVLGPGDRQRRTTQERFRDLADEVMGPGTGPRDRGIPPEQFHDLVRRRTHFGDTAPVLCDTTPWGRIAPLLDAIVRYLPSPLEVCQPEHTLD